MCKSHIRMEKHAGRAVVGCNAIFAGHFNTGIRSAGLPDISPAYSAHDQLITGNEAAIGMDWKRTARVYDCVIDFAGRLRCRTRQKIMKKTTKQCSKPTRNGKRVRA